LFITERYLDQVNDWPKSGKHILAQFDADSVVVYQAYRPSIGEFAATHGYFGGEFSYSRMSWIKTNFLWMMYRSGWGMKAGQEVTLAIRIRRSFFDCLLAQAVESSFVGSQYATHSDWQKAVTASSVRMQWDPDHHPRGASLPRRALQLGLRRKPLKDFGKREILELQDISAFVSEQRMNISSERIAQLITPVERVYVPDDPEVRVRLGIDEIDATKLFVS
jgi:Domain of unknown function (DUF4291)